MTTKRKIVAPKGIKSAITASQSVMDLWRAVDDRKMAKVQRYKDECTMLRREMKKLKTDARGRLIMSSIPSTLVHERRGQRDAFTLA
jgi:hypothetical protein